MHNGKYASSVTVLLSVIILTEVYIIHQPNLNYKPNVSATIRQSSSVVNDTHTYAAIKYKYSDKP